MVNGRSATPSGRGGAGLAVSNLGREAAAGQPPVCPDSEVFPGGLKPPLVDSGGLGFPGVGGCSARFEARGQALARGSAPSIPKDARAPLRRASSPSVRAVSGRARWSLARRLRSRSMARAGAVDVRLRAIVGRRDLAGDVRAAAMTVRRSAGSAPATGFATAAPTAPLSRQRRGKLGVQGGRSVPLARPQCSTYDGLRTLRVPDSLPASVPDGLRRCESRVGGVSIPVNGEARFRQCQPRESRRFPKGSSAVPESDRSPATAPPSPPAAPARALQSRPAKVAVDLRQSMRLRPGKALSLRSGEDAAVERLARAIHSPAVSGCKKRTRRLTPSAEPYSRRETQTARPTRRTSSASRS